MRILLRATGALRDGRLLLGLVLVKALFALAAAWAPAAAWHRAVAGAPADPAATGLPSLDLFALAGAAGAGVGNARAAALAPALLYAILFGVFSGGVWARLAGRAEDFGAATARCVPAFAGVLAAELLALAGIAALHGALEAPAWRHFANEKTVTWALAPMLGRHGGAALAVGLVALWGGLARARVAAHAEGPLRALAGAAGAGLRRAAGLAAVVLVSGALWLLAAAAFWAFAATELALSPALGALALAAVLGVTVASRVLLWAGEVAAVAPAQPGAGEAPRA